MSGTENADAILREMLERNSQLKALNPGALKGGRPEGAPDRKQASKAIGYRRAHPQPKQVSKYHAVRTPYRGIWYASGREARYAEELDLRVQAGEVLWWLPQVPFRLAGGVKYVADFLEVWANGSVHVVDVKGVKTAIYKLKKKQVEERYPIRIEER